ncbi:hypothetical protein GCM10028895_10450 [Pontibacter rugosus]
MVILETPYAVVTYREPQKVLLLTWLQKPVLSDLKSLYMQTLAFVKEHPFIVKYCSDLTLMGSFSREQENWLMHEFYPEVHHIINDNIFVAVVFSESHFNAIVMNYQATTMLPIHQIINFNYFTAQDEAVDWLVSVKKGQDTALLTD